jgi:hypothetical protein
MGIKIRRGESVEMKNVIKVAISISLALIVRASAQTANVIDGSSGNIDDKLRQRAIALLSEGLKDPMSAQVRHLRPGRYPESVCGEVNAKNSMGGYVGFVPFYVLPYLNEAFVLDRTSLSGSAWGENTFRENGCL